MKRTKQTKRRAQVASLSPVSPVHRFPLKINLQRLSRLQIPSRRKLRLWVLETLDVVKKIPRAISARDVRIMQCTDALELTIRVVNRAESAMLNFRYRNKKVATNILSFPSTVPVELKLPFLGDLVICAPVVAKEAKEQGKLLGEHWAHIIVHGVLHLLGFDHVKAKQAKIMEKLEVKILANLGVADPYSY